jgi:hypothetical protein
VATKDEVVRGLELLIQETKRLGDSLTPEQWAKSQDFDGWKNTETLAHVASVGTLVIPMSTGFANAPAGSDAGAGIDINQLNAQLVGARKDKSVGELVGEAETAYRGVIEWVKGAQDDMLARPVTFGGYVDVPLSDILVRMVVLHGLAHVYSAYAAVMGL